MIRRSALLGVGSALLLTTLLPTGLRGQEWRTLAMSKRLEGEGPLTVDVRYMAGDLDLRAAEEGMLYRMRLRYDADALEPITEVTDERLRLGVRGARDGVDFEHDTDGGEMELELGPTVPVDLDLEFGAVRADLDLGGLSLVGFALTTGASETRLDVSSPNRTRMERARIEVGVADFEARRLGNLRAERIDVTAGVGDVTLDLSGSWDRDGHIAVDMKLGEVEFVLPRGVGVKLIDRGSFLSSTRVEDLVRRGSDYYSENWDEAGRRLTLEVDAAFGAVSVTWLR